MLKENFNALSVNNNMKKKLKRNSFSSAFILQSNSYTTF